MEYIYDAFGDLDENELNDAVMYKFIMKPNEEDIKFECDFGYIGDQNEDSDSLCHFKVIGNMLPDLDYDKYSECDDGYDLRDDPEIEDIKWIKVNKETQEGKEVSFDEIMELGSIEEDNLYKAIQDAQELIEQEAMNAYEGLLYYMGYPNIDYSKYEEWYGDK